MQSLINNSDTDKKMFKQWLYGEFENFADIKKRVKLMPDPKQAIVRRIVSELEGKEKHPLFVDR